MLKINKTNFFKFLTIFDLPNNPIQFGSFPQTCHDLAKHFDFR